MGYNVCIMAEKDKIKKMFSSIAVRYDLLNHILSLNFDKRWRKKLNEAMPDIPQAIVLDHCGGTADLSIEIANSRRKIICTDFSHDMLVIGQEKILKRQLTHKINLMEADSLMLPLKDGTVDVVTVTFGIRNLNNLEQAFQEMLRVLKKGGSTLILEFSKPTQPMFRIFYSLYRKGLLPLIGGLISRHKEAYHYLSTTIGSFPDQESVAFCMLQAGFQEVGYQKITGGIVTLYKGFK